MMVLALLCLLGMSAVQSTTLEVQLSARDRDARAALYVAEAALEEARYYLARGWGKTAPAGTGRVRVVTRLPGLPDVWVAGRYAGFTLFDREGRAFPVHSNTGGFPAEVTVAGGDPTPGPFVLVRDLPAVGGSELPTVGWDDFFSELRVEDPTWAESSAPDLWTGWVVWNPVGQGFPVVASGTLPEPPTVWLRLTGNPGDGPFRMARHPWAEALAAGHGVPGDQDPDTPGWDRIFPGGAAHATGTATVEARADAGEAGRFTLSSVGTVGHSRRRVSLSLRRAGLPDQQLRDWKVDDAP